MTLTSHGNLNLKGFIHHYGDYRTLSVVLVSSEISAFSASLREVIASNEKMNCRIYGKSLPVGSNDWAWATQIGTFDTESTETPPSPESRLRRD